MSLGASRWRLVRQLLVESLMLSMAGGAIALLITFWTEGTLMKFLPVGEDIPLSLNVTTDRTVLLAALVISLLTGVIFGILPAMRTSGVAPVAVLKEDTGSASGGLRKARLASGLVVAQISLSLLLLICAGLFIRSFRSAQSINPGFNAHNVMIASYDLFTAGYSDASGAEFDRQLIEKLKAMPGAVSVALANRVPLAFGGGSTSVKPEGYVLQPNESMETQVALITPNYFQTLQIPMVKGRDFTAADTMSSQRVTIVSQAFANRYWPNQEALGKQMESDLTHEKFTVVGVARDYKVNSLSEKPMPFVYLPHYQVYRPGLMMVVRTTGDPMTFSKAAQNSIHEMNADLVVYDTTTLELRNQISSFPLRIAGTFVGAFGLLALVLAAVGIYGVTLGASKQDILRLVLGHGLRLTFIGVGIGLAAAFALTRFLKILLLGVTSTDALTFTSVAVLLCAVALFACFIPAWRAMRVDPMVALRYE
jgi:predicted permease